MSKPDAAVAAPFPGTDRYEVRGVLGSGGMGTVYRVWDREYRAEVALKVLGDVSPHQLVRFQEEFRAVSGLSHPNLLALGELDYRDRPFFTMELVSGETLAAYAGWDPDQQARTLPLSPRAQAVHGDAGATPVPIARIRHAFVQLLEGLAYLHEAGIVHRDLKPSNILVDDPAGRARVVIGDFGLALRAPAERRLSEDGLLLGTAAYMAPEQASDPSCGAPADCYAAGVMLYQCLTGRLPHQGNPMAMLLAKKSGDPVPPHDVVGPVDDEVERLCLELLDRDPARRPTARQALSRLGGTGTASRPPGPAGDQPANRPAELARLTGLLDGSRARCAVIEGPAGAGKSELLERFARLIPGMRPGAQVFRARCDEREDGPYQGLEPVVEQAVMLLARGGALPGADHRPALVRAFPALAPALGEDAHSAVDLTPAPAGDARAEVATALRRALAAVTRQHTAVILIDDAHWMGPDSFAVLAAALRPPAEPPVLLILARRASELSILVPPERGLDIPVITVALSSAARAPIARAPLSPAAMALAQLISVGRGPVTRATLRLASEQAFGEFTRAIHELAQEGAIDVHGPRAADTVELTAPGSRRVGDLDDEQSRDLHRRWLDALGELGLVDQQPEVASHHAEAAGDPALAVQLAVRAAERARRMAAPEMAARHYLRAAALSADGGARDRLRRLAAESLAAAGRGIVAADRFEALARDSSDPAERIDLRWRAADALLAAGAADAGRDAAARLLKELGERLPGGRRRLLAGLIARRARLRRRALAAPATARGELRPRLEAYRTLGQGFAMVDNLLGAYYQTRYLELALQAGTPADVVRALGIEAVFQASQLSAGRARTLAATARDQAAALADPLGEIYVQFADAGVAFMLDCDFAEAWRAADAGERLAREQGWTGGWEVATARLVKALSLMQLGRLRELEERTAGYISDAELRGDHYLAVSLRTRLAVRWLVLGEPERARADVDQAVAGWGSAATFTVQNYYALHSLAEIELYRGDVDRAAALIAEALPALRRSLLLRVGIVRAELHYLDGRIAAARGDRKAGRRAVARLRAISVPLAAGWADLLDGDPGAAERLADLGAWLFAGSAWLRAGDDRGSSWAAVEGIRDPARFAATFAPAPPG